MAKNHKKSKAKAAGNHTDKQVWNNTLKILKETCAKLAGPEVFAGFSKLCILRIIGTRYPAINMRAAANSGIPAPLLKELNSYFKNMLIREPYQCATGESIALNTYMREGLMLLHYIECMEELGIVPAKELAEAFSPYQREGEYYLKAVRTVVQIMCRFCTISSDWSKSIFVYDIGLLCALGGEAPNNEILVKAHKPEVRFLKLESHNRELIRAGWSDFSGNVNWLQTEPQKLGFITNENQPADVYIQRHALQRLQERISLVPGLMHEAIYDTFRDQDFEWHKRSEKRIISYKVQGKKLGYLVCSFDEGIIIIRSFLFLTNSGTPEGNKLSELTKLAPLDKQYLGIDTLPGFAGFDFSKDPALAGLFTQSGCQDLLDLTDLIPFSKSQVREQDTESLLKYLGTRVDERVNDRGKELSA